MPLVHELIFGAINQLSGIYLYKCIHLRNVFTVRVDCILSSVVSLLKCIKHKRKHYKIEISLFK